MKKTWAILLLLLVISPYISAKTKTDHPFFKHVHLGYPGLGQLPFFISSDNYASAFLSLTHWINSHVEFSTYRDQLPPSLRKVVENQVECNLEVFSFTPALQDEWSPLEKFIAMGDMVTSRYRDNQLSAVWAEKGLTHLLDFIKQAVKEPQASSEQAALLKIAIRLHFFKDTRVWGKKLKRLQKKLNKQPRQPLSALAETILK